MGNPFEIINTRLANIECMLVDLKNEKVQPIKVETDKILDVKEAGEFLHLKVPTIYGLISKRILPSLKRGKRVYFKKSELTLWLEGGQRKTIEQLEIEARNITTRGHHKRAVAA